VLLTTEHLHQAADRLDEAVTRLRVHGSAGVNHEVGSLTEQLPEIHAWLTGLRQNPEWARDFYRSYAEFALVVAEALRRTESDASGVDRVEDGWHVARGRPVICFGDTHLDADLVLDGPLIVLGDLTVDGLLSDGDVDRSFLVVTGNLRATALHSGAFTVVTGAIEARVIVCFTSDGGLGAGGDIVADLFVQDEHSYELGGELRVRVPILDWLADGTILDNDLTPGERLAAVLPEDYVSRDDDGDVEVDTGRLLRQTAAGCSPLRLTPS
jgi:hypothetical protein